MSLDRNLFTLLLTPNAAASRPDEGVTVVDLVDPNGTVHYRKRRFAGGVYKAELYEPVSGSLLACMTAPSATSKHKTMELYNPTKVVELKFTGTLSFKWAFKWEEHEFEWRREECFIVRKPDPPVLVAVTKEPPGRIKTSSVQLLDYNLQRFDIDDRKGLEIIILFALLTFQDSSDVHHDLSAPAAGNTADPAAVATASQANPGNNKVAAAAPPPIPPKPAPKTGVDRIAELQQGHGQVNEVGVAEEGDAQDYAKYCSRLLQDDAMLFISVRSVDAPQVPKVLQVVEETKRIRHKAGDPELHQYVLYDTEKQKGPRIIKLDDGPASGKMKGKEYTPPRSLVVHLSKIDMPELRPRGTPLPPGRGMEPDAGKGAKNKKEKEKDKTKDKDKKDRPSAMPRPNSSPSETPQGRIPRPQQSQHFQTYPMSAHPPPHRPPRAPHQPPPHGQACNSWGVPPPPPPQHARPLNRPTQPQPGPGYHPPRYGSWQGQPVNAPPPHAPASPSAPPQPNSSGFFGRLLGM